MTWMWVMLAFARPGDPPADAPKVPDPPPLCEGLEQTLSWLEGTVDAPLERAWTGALQCETQANKVLGRYQAVPGAAVVCTFPAEGAHPLDPVRQRFGACLTGYSVSPRVPGEPRVTWAAGARGLRLDAVHEGERIVVTAKKTR